MNFWYAWLVVIWIFRIKAVHQQKMAFTFTTILF